MSGASMKQIKTRIKSVESTRQITKAMELVATSKLRRAKERAENSRPFHQVLAEAISCLQATAAEAPSVFTEQREVKRTCYVVIAGDRGLAGGYNANLFRMVKAELKPDDCIIPVGKKALEHYRRGANELVSSYFAQTASIGIGDCKQLAKLLCDGYAEGKFDRVMVAYTYFQNMLSQVPKMDHVLPIKIEKGRAKYANALLEGSAEDLIAAIIPQYISGILYATVCEAAASEHGARRSAMNAANKNATEIIDTLVLKFNRARQAVITQEITEIVSGAEAL